MGRILPDKVVFQEMFSGALERFCRGESGYVYRCVGKCEMSESHGFKTCLNTATISFAAIEAKNGKKSEGGKLPSLFAC